MCSNLAFHSSDYLSFKILIVVIVTIVIRFTSIIVSVQLDV